MGDTRLRYCLGLFVGLTTDMILGILHLALPFIVVMLVGPVATLLLFFLYVYLAYSVVFTALIIARKLYYAGYIEHKKLAREWHNYIFAYLMPVKKKYQYLTSFFGLACKKGRNRREFMSLVVVVALDLQISRTRGSERKTRESFLLRLFCF